MSQFIPLDALEKRPAEPGTFDLWLPNSVMGRALFLRLPLDLGWTFEFNPGEAEASRYMVYRDRMWVSEGKTRFFTIRPDGSRVEVKVKVKRWKPRSLDCHRSLVGRRLLRRLLRGSTEELMESRCCRTERQLGIRWKAEDSRPVPTGSREGRLPTSSGPDVGGNPGLARSDVALLLSELRCH
jgi:hypothetical protein